VRSRIGVSIIVDCVIATFAEFLWVNFKNTILLRIIITYQFNDRIRSCILLYQNFDTSTKIRNDDTVCEYATSLCKSAFRSLNHLQNRMFEATFINEKKLTTSALILKNKYPWSLYFDCTGLINVFVRLWHKSIGILFWQSRYYKWTGI